jgi:hypothetical protein
MGKTRLPKKPMPNKQVDEFQSLVKRINENEANQIEANKKANITDWIIIGLLIINFIGDMI